MHNFPEVEKKFQHFHVSYMHNKHHKIYFMKPTEIHITKEDHIVQEKKIQNL